MNVDRFAYPAFIFFIFVKAFSGPIGMMAPFINYSAVAIMLLLLSYKWSKTIFKSSPLIILSGLFLLFIILGTLNSGLIQTMFGVYIFIPFMFCVAYSEVLFYKIIYSSIKYFIFFGVTDVLGIIYVNVFGAPWLGSVLDIGGYSKVLSRDWTAGGALRNPGFTGASFDAATLLLISFFFILYNLRMKRNWIGYLIVFMMPIYPIYLTTTKTTILTYVILSFVMLLPTLATITFSKLSIFFSVIFSYYFMLPGNGQSKYDQTNTFLQRMYDTWPHAIGLLKDNLSFIIGKGIGGIGTPSLLFSPEYYNPADNALVYLYVIGGVVSIALVIIFLMKFLSSSFHDKYAGGAYYILAFCIFTGGVTYNLFESVFYAPFAGVLVGVIFNRNFCLINRNGFNKINLRFA